MARVKESKLLAKKGFAKKPVEETTKRGRPQKEKVKVKVASLKKKIVETGEKEKLRHRPGYNAKREITKYKNSTDLLVRKLPF